MNKNNKRLVKTFCNLIWVNTPSEYTLKHIMQDDLLYLVAKVKKNITSNNNSPEKIKIKVKIDDIIKNQETLWEFADTVIKEMFN